MEINNPLAGDFRGIKVLPSWGGLYLVYTLNLPPADAVSLIPFGEVPFPQYSLQFIFPVQAELDQHVLYMCFDRFFHDPQP